MGRAQCLVVLLVSAVSAQYGHQGGRPGYGHNQCVVDNLQKYGDVCIPTLHTDCEKETTRNGIQIETDEECYKVVRTICKEDSEVVNNEVCATYYEQRRVDAEIKTVTAKFEKVCKDEAICVAPPPAAAYGYQGPAECAKEYRHVCYKEPILIPLTKKVSIMLPYPLEKCVTYPILLPRISCTQVEDKKCMAVPRVRKGLLLTVNKCSVNFGDPECSETVLTLPRQGCPSKMTNIKNIYEYVEETGYGVAG